MQKCLEENQVSIRVNLNPLKATSAFPYLIHTVAYNNRNWAELYSNLRKAQRRWGVVEKVMGKTGAPIKYQAMMYKVVFQAVLLYGRKIWVVTYRMMTVLYIFHLRISRQISVMGARKVDSREW